MRFWLIVLFVVFGLIPCLASYVWTVKTSEQRAISVRTAEIQNQCTILSNQLNSYQYLTNPSSEVIDANLTQLTNIYNGRVMIINQNLDVIKDTYGLDEGKTMVSENVIRCLRQGKSTSYYDKKNRYVEVTAPVISEEKAVTGVDAGQCFYGYGPGWEPYAARTGRRSSDRSLSGRIVPWDTCGRMVCTSAWKDHCVY